MKREEAINNAAVQYATHFIDTDETDFYGHFVKELGLDDAERRGFIAGAKWADKNPKSPWISVEDDLPCNHEEMVVSSGIEEKDTLIVLVRFAVGFVDFAYMYYSNNEWRWNTYFKVSHWMLVPEFRED